jgi:hypothetical protein
MRLFAAVVATLAVALVGSGAAYACHGPPSELARSAFMHDRGTHGVLAVTAGYLGIDKSTLKADLMAGKTIADVAPAGKTSAGLADAFATALKAKLDEKVAAQKMTPATEDAILAKIDAKLPAFAAWLWTKQFTSGEHGRHFSRHHHHG